MIRAFGVAALAVMVTCTAAFAQEVKRTEISRAPVSGDPGKEIVVQIVEVPPGATSPRHLHNGEEVFYVLDGAMTQMPDGAKQERVTGSVGINKRGVPHAGYKVIGDKTLKMMSVYVVDKDKPLQVPAP